MGFFDVFLYILSSRSGGRPRIRDRLSAFGAGAVLFLCGENGNARKKEYR